jgi:uncharacterized protein (TIGR03089 family)
VPADPRVLTVGTGGLVGARDLAQPLLTLRTPEGRVELSGATVANWVAKNANLLVDGYGTPAVVGIRLPLHWQTVCLLLGAVATGATVVLSDDPDQLAATDLLFTAVDLVDDADGPLEVLAVSTHPLGAPTPSVPAGVGDHAREVPSYADFWSGPVPRRTDLLAGGGERPGALEGLDVGPEDRVVVAVDPREPTGLALLLAVLRAGAALVLVPDPGAVDLGAIAAEERATASAGVDVAGLRRLG